MIGRPPSSSWSRWRDAFSDAGHLSLDAVVAHVDDELPAGAAARAAAHVDRCPACAGEVAAQRQARRRLRGADCPGVPSSLLSSLRDIPQHAEVPTTPAGLALDEQGRFVVAEPGPESPAPCPAPARPPRWSGRLRGGSGPAATARPGAPVPGPVSLPPA